MAWRHPSGKFFKKVDRSSLGGGGGVKLFYKGKRNFPLVFVREVMKLVVEGELYFPPIRRGKGVGVLIYSFRNNRFFAPILRRIKTPDHEKKP